MDDSDNSLSKAEDEIKTSGDEGKAEEGTADLGRILEDELPPLDSVVKPFVEKLTEAAESLVQKVTQSSSSSYVTEMGKEVEKMVLVSDPWASLKNMAPATESSLKGTEETLPTSDENVGEAVTSTSAEAKEVCLDENPRATHTQPFVAVAATSQASWINCCGLLDILRPSDQ